MSKRTWIIFVVVVIGLLSALVISARIANPPIDVSAVDPAVIQSASDANGQIADHVFGKADSKVILMEYGDFQCPGCGSAHPRIKAITEQYQNELAFVYRNFPLTSIHPNAKAAAAAAEGAGLQGKYWEMHDIVFENQRNWESQSGNARTDIFIGYARDLGLDITKFSADLNAESINQKISFDQAIAKKVGVESTPTFYLNGVLLGSDIWGDDAKLKAAIDTELTKAGVPLPGSTE